MIPNTIMRPIYIILFCDFSYYNIITAEEPSSLNLCSTCHLINLLTLSLVQQFLRAKVLPFLETTQYCS